MIIFNKEKIKETTKWKDNNFYILTDFDRTLTSKDSYVSWDILSRNDLVSYDYLVDVNNLYKYYRPIEINKSLSVEEKTSYMVDW